MLSQFFKAQWNHPTVNDWSEQAKQDMADFGLESDLEFVKSKSKWSFQNMIKLKAKEYALYYLLEKQDRHSKLDSLFYTEIKMQDYLKELTTAQAQTVLAYRTRMANYNDNYRGCNGHLPCPLCLLHLDCQSVIFNCPVVKENVNLNGQYSEIFRTNIKPELAQSLVDIEKFRKEYMESRQVK